jgi:hypothetical protein
MDADVARARGSTLDLSSSRKGVTITTDLENRVCSNPSLDNPKEGGLGLNLNRRIWLHCSELRGAPYPLRSDCYADGNAMVCFPLFTAGPSGPDLVSSASGAFLSLDDGLVE